MDPIEAQKFILEQCKVTPQHVSVAKALIMSTCNGLSSSENLVDYVRKANGVALPHQIVFDRNVDPIPALTAAAHALSWTVAAKEAILSLVHGGYLIAMRANQDSTPSIQWSMPGQSSGWRFEELAIPVPSSVRRSPSQNGSTDQFLAEPDLYLNTFNIPNMHTDVALALREAVVSFRHELFSAAVAMLGKASEGAWLELGGSLLKSLKLEQRSAVKKQREDLENPMAGTLKKITAVQTLFRRQDFFADLSDQSGVKPNELQIVATWSDSVRDSRNVVHFGVSPATPNTYEKAAVLLLAAVPYLRILYRIKAAADDASESAN